MTPAAFVDRARAAGVTLWGEGGVLRYRGPREAVEKLVPVFKAHKPVILAAIDASARESDDLREYFRERAAILEHDAGLSKPEAELEAVRITCALARNRGYLWASLRSALSDHPGLDVDALPLGVSKVHVLRDGRVLRQGEFTGSGVSDGL